MLARVLHVLAPSTCAGCALPGEPLCARCRAALRGIEEPLCAGCGHPYAVATPRCSECRGRIIGARAAVRYEGPVPRLVRGLKDGGRPALAELLAELVVEWTPAPPLEATLVPVPLSPAREAARGFNQSALLARALSARWRRPWARALDRVGPERSQRGAGAAARTEHVRGAFLARARDELPCSVCLVDDVHTTGATLAAAAHALWLAGVRSVTARCFARALRRR